MLEAKVFHVPLELRYNPQVGFKLRYLEEIRINTMPIRTLMHSGTLTLKIWKRSSSTIATDEPKNSVNSVTCAFGRKCNSGALMPFIASARNANDSRLTAARCSISNGDPTSAAPRE